MNSENRVFHIQIVDCCENGGIKAQYDYSHLDRYTHARYFNRLTYS